MMSDDQPHLEGYVEAIAANQPAIRAFILAMVRQSGAVDDVLQETNLALWQRRDEYDASRPFVGWACGIARYQVLNHFKQSRRVAKPLDPAVVSELCDAAEHYAEQADRRVAALRWCLEQLPAKQRAILDMRYENERAVKDIAVELSQSENAISSVLFRARKALSRCIERRLTGEAP